MHVASINDRIKHTIRFTTIDLLRVFPFDAAIIHPNLKTILKEMSLPPFFSYSISEYCIDPSRFP